MPILNTIKSVSTKHLSFVILLLFVGTYLFLKALPENSWDGYGVATAQTMLTVKHWTKDGWIKNYFLSIAHGYSKTIQYLDEPELNHHAYGMVGGGMISKKLHYTHFPPGAFLFFYGPFAKLGFEQRFWFRWLAIIISLGGLIMLYKFLTLAAGKTAAFWGSAFYAVSITFLNFADTVSDAIITDLFKYSILFISFLALKTRKNYKWLLWLLYLVLSFSSYDSTFFIFAWLLGLDILIRKEWAWKRWLFFASAPILAFVIQIIQNTWYLGWSDMILDFWGTYIRRGAQISSASSLKEYGQAFYHPFKLMFALNQTGRVIILLMSAVAAGIFYLAIKFKELLGDAPKILLILFAAAIIQPLLILATSAMVYEGRQIAPAVIVAVSILTMFIYKKIAGNIKNITVKSAPSLGISFLILVFFWSLQIPNTISYLKQWPNHVADASIITLSKEIKARVPGDRVGFYLYKPKSELGPPPTDLVALNFYDSERYPQTPSINEYYFDMLMLGFTNIPDLVRDLVYLKNRSEYPFSAILIVENEKAARDLSEKIAEKKLSEMPPKIKNLEGKFIIIVPPQA